MTIATSHVLLHRFYCQSSLMDFDVRTASMTALWLATKLEETHVSTPGLLRIFDRITRRQDASEERILDPLSGPYYEMHAELIDTERAMLAALGFNCHVEHPHKLIINVVKVVLDWDTQLCQLAWSLCNDRYEIGSPVSIWCLHRR